MNVFGSTLGGSFGGKDDIINSMACRAALLSNMTGKAIKLTYTREESMRESYKRHPYILNYKVGFNNDGKLRSMKINIIADSGAYSSQSFFVTWRSVVQATGPYEIENVQTDIRSVYTNNPYTAAFRGFGSPQIIFAQESLMDEIADICNLTPLEIRKLNGFKQGSVTASGQVLSEHKVSLDEVIEKAIERSDYKNKLEELSPDLGKANKAHKIAKSAEQFKNILPQGKYHKARIAAELAGLIPAVAGGMTHNPFLSSFGAISTLFSPLAHGVPMATYELGSKASKFLAASLTLEQTPAKAESSMKPKNERVM